MDMQTCCRAMIGSLEVRKNCFNYLKEQRAYYTDLLANDGKISELGGKYKFFGEPSFEQGAGRVPQIFGNNKLLN